VFEAVPVATHNPRGIGTLRFGCPEGCETDIDALELVKIVEASMSS
jgi:GTP cyclohydrolase-4